MPEHVPLLVSEPERGRLSAAIQVLKQNSSRLLGAGGRRRNPAQQQLFPAEKTEAHLWQRRYYDFNVRTAKKRIEKLKYMHRNPVKRGLAEKPEDWRWSSYRSYALGESGPVGLNTWPKIKSLAQA
jgi:putative transposase